MPVLQHVAERCHAAKSLYRVSACIAAVLPSVLGSNASIVVDCLSTMLIHGQAYSAIFFSYFLLMNFIDNFWCSNLI